MITPSPENTAERPLAVLEWADDGAPRSPRFGDVYFSREDGLAETRAVFLEGCGLPDAWAGRDRFVVGELGLGTGLNQLALLDLWRRNRPNGGRLHLFSIEAYPMTAAEAARALAAWPDLADLTRLFLDAWPETWTPGFHRIDLPEFSATLDVAIGDADWALDVWGGRADAWFLDGFSPARNPEMWSDAVLDGVAARSAPGRASGHLHRCGRRAARPGGSRLRRREEAGPRPQARATGGAIPRRGRAGG